MPGSGYVKRNQSAAASVARSCWTSNKVPKPISEGFVGSDEREKAKEKIKKTERRR